MAKHLIAIPVYNEEKSLPGVLRQMEQVRAELGVDILVVDDGSKDGTAALLREAAAVKVVRHPANRGYGAALRSAFTYADEHDYTAILTIDSDGQHDPVLIPAFLAATREYDVVTGSRYLREFPQNTPAPPDRRRLNGLVTDQLNAQLGLSLTDTFCGFKAYRTSSLLRMKLTEDGYAMPLELWVQVACLGLKVLELPVPRVYLDPNRSFGATLDDATARLAYYQEVIDRSLARARFKIDCQLDSRKPVEATA